MTKNPRTYMIDTFETKYNSPPKRNYPIRFNDDTPLFASVGVVIVTDGLEHMRIPDGWINAFGEKLTNDEMRDLLIENHVYEDEADGPHITTVSRRRAARYLRTTPDMLECVHTKNDLEVLINTTLAPAWKKQIDAALALYDLSTGHKPQVNKDLESLQIIYTDDKGCLYIQPLSDLSDVGTLVDPNKDTDLTIVGYTIA